MKSILSHCKNKITLEELQTYVKHDSYPEFVKNVNDLVQKGYLKPIYSSRGNGKTPSLYMRYRICRPQVNREDLMDELLYKINPNLKIDYYLKNLKAYEEDRNMILYLNQFLEEESGSLQEKASFNERSFEIWCREKYLLREGGLRVLGNLGVSSDFLNVYETSEPLAYYSHHKMMPQNILILENKDTFYTMRKHLLDGKETICGVPIGTLIYGGGKSVYKSFQDFGQWAEPYLVYEENQFYYFGDLDYEGILIYETLAGMMMDKVRIEVFVPAYVRMLTKVKEKGISSRLPQMKEKQNHGIKRKFMENLSVNTQEQVMKILDSNCYIPQEILQTKDL